MLLGLQIDYSVRGWYDKATISCEVFMEKNRLHSFLQSGLWVIALVCTAAVGMMNLIYTAQIAYDASEKMQIVLRLGSSLLQLTMLGLLLLSCGICRERLLRLDEKKLFRFLTGVYTVLAVYLLLNVDPVLRADPKSVFNSALEMKDKVYDSVQKGGYLYQYPHQLGLVSYMRLLTVFSENPMVVFLGNFLLVLGINRTWWQISRVLFADKLVSLLTMILCFTFLPQLFFILFAYGLIPGFFFLSLGFYCTLRFLQGKQWKYLVGMGLFTGLAVLMKQNYLIGGIAQLLVLLLDLLRQRNIRIPAAMLALLLCMSVPGSILRAGYERAGEVELDNASPSVLWVAMGTDIDNDKRAPGWYNSYSWQVYQASDHDRQKAAEVGWEKITENFEKIRQEPGRAAKFFLEKNITQWCDPLFQSLWTGPLKVCGQHTHTQLLDSLYNGDTWEDNVAGFCRTLCLGIWILSVAFLLLWRKSCDGWELLFLYFVGGLLFHTVWEAKSQYIYTYVFVLIPIAAYGAGRVADRIGK